MPHFNTIISGHYRLSTVFPEIAPQFLLLWNLRISAKLSSRFVRLRNIGFLLKNIKTGKIGNFPRKYMKNLCILLLVALTAACLGFSGCGGGSHAQVPHLVEERRQPIAFVYDHVAGLELARQDRKPSLIFFSVPDNVGSQRMLDTTFTDDEIKRLAERLICIHVDGSQEPALCEAFEITSFPTIILFNTNGMEVRRLVGRQTPDQLAVQIHVLLQATALRTQGAGR